MPPAARNLCLTLAVMALAGAAVVGAGLVQAATPRAAVAKATSAKVVECARGTTPEARRATFRAGMTRVSGAARMSVRFSLEESTAGGPYEAVPAPGLGVWRKSRSGVRAFAYRQQVKALAEGSAYRVRVAYRWHRANGKVLKSAQRRSSACRQTDPQPNLRVQAIGGRAVEGAPDRVRYTVSVVNRGQAPAPATRAMVWVDGQVVGRADVPPLTMGQAERVFVVGPRCRSGVSAQADADRAVGETNETDNARAAGCPDVR